MTLEQIHHMVTRFLGWRLPENFSPDAGISFKPEYNVEFNAKRGLPPNRHQPVGTNLFDADQAVAMVRYMVEGLPAAEDHAGDFECPVCGAHHPTRRWEDVKRDMGIQNKLPPDEFTGRLRFVLKRVGAQEQLTRILQQEVVKPDDTFYWADVPTENT